MYDRRREASTEMKRRSTHKNKLQLIIQGQECHLLIYREVFNATISLNIKKEQQFLTAELILKV
ncbi:hypothetical protein C0J52_02289 [Blattella germanica]|nr:hypothetical protein C0J52_02289 [Blattella germanica]